MKRNMKQAVGTTTAQTTVRQRKSEHKPVFLSREINEFLAILLFSLHTNPRSSERSEILNSIGWLIRLKIKLGLIPEVQHAN